MSIKLPLLAEPAVRGVAASTHASARASGHASGRAGAIEAHARPVASRTWLALIGTPGDEAPARFACALAHALAPRPCYALLSAQAPSALEQALCASGCEALRLTDAPSEHALQHVLTAVPADGIVLVVESELAAQLRGVLDIWVGSAPSSAASNSAAPNSTNQLVRLYLAADVVLPASAFGVASALAVGLVNRLSSDQSRINGHTNAA